jgi:hypothetical protein
MMTVGWRARLRSDTTKAQFPTRPSSVGLDLQSGSCGGRRGARESIGERPADIGPGSAAVLRDELVRQADQATTTQKTMM